MTSAEDVIHAMPKCELHVHIEGTLEPELKFTLAQRNGMTLPHADAASMRAAYRFHDLSSFLQVYYEGMSVLHTEEDFHDLCLAYLTKARSQNVVYAEIFFDPQAHLGRGVPFGRVIKGLRRAQMQAEETLGIRSQLVMCFLRERSAGEAMRVLEGSLRYRDWIVGVGLDSYEPGNPPNKFSEVFARARQEGYRLTAHCDVNQPDTHEHLRQALADVAVDRIDHGVNVLDKPELIALAQQRGVPFTLCPVANQMVLGEGAQEPVRRMLALGLPVTLNSDDPAYMLGHYLEDNFRVVQRALNLDIAQLLTLSRNAFQATWLQPPAQAHYLAQLDRFEQEALAPG